MLDVVDGVLALGAGWLVTYLVHTTVLIGTAWLAVRSGWVSEPESQDLLWKVAALGGLVTATAAMSPTVRMGPQEFIADVEVTGVRGAGIENTMQWQMRQLDAPAELSISSLRAEVVSPSPECRELLRGGALGAPGAAARIRSTCAASAEVEWYHVMVLLWWGERRRCGPLHSAPPGTSGPQGHVVRCEAGGPDRGAGAGQECGGTAARHGLVSPGRTVRDRRAHHWASRTLRE